MLNDLGVLKAKVDDLRARASKRDAAMRDILKVRGGEIELLAPELFDSADWPRAMIANFIDTAARDLAETLAPLPTLSCASGAMKTDSDKARAAKKNKIGAYIWESSNLEQSMFWGADQFITYGFLPFYIAPDDECMTPVIHLEDPIGVYYENDYHGRTRIMVKVWRQSAAELAATFPEFRHQILTDERGFEVDARTQLELIRYCDDTGTTLFLNEKRIVLAQYANVTDKCPASVIEWPGLVRGLVRGRFDDLIWVQIARAAMAQMALSAGYQAVNAPIQVPQELNELPTGPGAVIRTNGHVARVGLEIPQSAFAIDQTLEHELEQGARYPGARTGNIQASVITGKGVQELLGSFDTQIKMAQTLLKAGLKAATSIALEMLEKHYPGSRSVNGTWAGESYQLTFDPAKDIGRNYVVDVTYGFAAGLSPANAIVMLLQLRGDNLIDRDTVRRQLPWPIDVDQTQRDVDVQEMRDGIRQGLAGLAQSIGAMVQGGQDPTPVLLAVSKVIAGRRDGVALESLVADAFAPAPAPEAPPGAPGPPAGGVDPTTGLPPGVAPGQAGLPPGGQPDIQSLLAGLRGGKPVLDASIRRMIPA